MSPLKDRYIDHNKSAQKETEAMTHDCFGVPKQDESSSIPENSSDVKGISFSTSNILHNLVFLSAEKIVTTNVANEKKAEK